MIDSALLDVVGRLGLDLLVLLALLGLRHRGRPLVPEMTLVLAALNVGLFAAIAVIGVGDFPTGVGFGLFGLLSLVRLRSAAFSLADVAYTFAALVLALVNALPGRDVPMVVLLDLVILAGVWVTDDARRRPPTHRVRVLLDRAVADEGAARALLAERLTAVPIAVVIEDVDVVRDTTRVSVLLPGGAAWSTLPMPPEAIDPELDATVLDARGPR